MAKKPPPAALSRDKRRAAAARTHPSDTSLGRYHTAPLCGLPEIVFGNTMLALPESFSVYPSRLVHGWAAKALFLVIGCRLNGVLFHPFRLNDRRLSRMGFGKKTAL